MPMERDPPSRPKLALRVGVTGARALEDDALALLRANTRAVLTRIKARIGELSTALAMHALYADGGPLLRLISPLAEGADRLVAEAALALGYRLEAPLPFAQAEYERDFPGSAPVFRALLAQAGPHVLELPGARGDVETASYEAVGRLVVRNADVMIAIWNGRAARGRGGTAEIAAFAVHCGVPVFWLPADGDVPRWIGRTDELPGGAVQPAIGEAAFARLDAWLAEEILPGTDPVHFADLQRSRAAPLRNGP